MEGVTDSPMRALLTELGGFSFCVSEFLRVSQDVPPAKVFRAHVPELLTPGCVTPSGRPVVIQLLGGDPGKLAESAQVAVRAGARAIDLNFGCPAPTVNRHDGGATLLKFPERIRGIVEAVRGALPRQIPVSAKLRLGWDRLDPIHENAEMAAQGGASWVTIHARTKMQGYQPPAYWGPIGEVNRRLGIPVVANGDIWTLEDFRRCQDETGCEHYMLGRSAMANPWLAAEVSRVLGIGTAAADTRIRGLADWVPLLERFAELSRPVSGGTGYTARRIKQWLRMAGQRQSRRWLDEVKTFDTTEQILLHLRNSAAPHFGFSESLRPASEPNGLLNATLGARSF
jgi:tRNA-dihydrouridine synthase C